MTVASASAYNLSDTEVIGDYILYWVGGPIFLHAHEGTLCNIYLVAWKEGWVTEVRLYSTSATCLDISQLHLLIPLSFAPHARACTAPSYPCYRRTSSC